MARTRQLQELRADAYLRSDNDGATDRHEVSDVDRYVNQGLAELYDLLVEARGRSYYRKHPPLTFATSSATTRYALPEDFYRLISVRIAGPCGETLAAFNSQEEALLRDRVTGLGRPTHYELQAGHIELLPAHRVGLSVVVDYVPVCQVLAADTDTFDGINGWEEYAALYAARCMATRDEDWELVAALSRDIGSYRERIAKLAPNRDAFRAERVKDVRGVRLMWSRWGR